MSKKKTSGFNINDHEDFPLLKRGYSDRYGDLNGKPCLLENHPGCKLWRFGCKNCAQYGCSSMGFGRDCRCVICGFPDEQNRTKIQQLKFDLMFIWTVFRWNHKNPKLRKELKKQFKIVMKKIKDHNIKIDAANPWKNSQFRTKMFNLRC